MNERPSYEPLVLHSEERFYVCVLENQRPRVVMTGAWHPDVGEYMGRHELVDLSLNTGMGWDGGGIAFLDQVPALRSLAVLDWRTRDLRPLLSHAGTLDQLIIECNPREIVRLGDLPALRWVSIDWERGWEGVLDGTPHGLRSLGVQNWPYADLQHIAALQQLEHLTLIGGRRLRDISHVRGRTGLRELGLITCHLLQDWSDLETCSGLVRVKLGCKALRSIDFVRSLPELEYLSVDKCDVETLAPLAACRALRRIALAGRVLDADLSVLLKLPKFEWAGIRNRKEYRPSRDEINEACRHRRGP